MFRISLGLKMCHGRWIALLDYRKLSDTDTIRANVECRIFSIQVGIGGELRTRKRLLEQT